LIPHQRGSEFFEVIYGHRVSPGTIVNAVEGIARRLETVEKEIKQLLIEEKVCHFDETSMRVKGDKHWVHVSGNAKLTHYRFHKKRGIEAMKAIGIYCEFKGKAIHDHLKSYFKNEDCRHGLCNAHHFRELRYIHEVQGIRWADKVSKLLMRIYEHKEAEIAKGKIGFSNYWLKKYSNAYDEIMHLAQREQAKRGTIDSHNLLRRLCHYKDAVLLFMKDFSVPFTNNSAEQDLRMNKVKQKISGTFRNERSGENFCRIRSVLSTAMKNKKNIFKLLQDVFVRNISIQDLVTDGSVHGSVSKIRNSS